MTTIETLLQIHETLVKTFASRFHSGSQRLVTLKECGTCGNLDFCSCREGEGIVIESRDLCDLFDPPCQVCSQVRMRNPEIFNWTLSVIAHALRNHK